MRVSITNASLAASLMAAAWPSLVLPSRVWAQSDTTPQQPVANTSSNLPRDLVVTATRVASPLDAIPAGVTVIDRATIQQRGYTTLAEALADVPGVRLVQSGGPGGNASLFIRGTNSNHALVLRDGMRIDDSSIANGAFNFGVDTLDGVERIEIVRGPASGLYGSGAIGGVVNIITRQGENDPKTGKPLASVTIAGGFPRAALGAASLSGASGIWDYAFNVETRSDRGFDATPKRETSVYTGERDGFRSRSVHLNLGVTPWTDTRFSLQLRGRTATFGYDNVAFPAFDDPTMTGHDSSVSGRFGAETVLLDGAWKTSLFLAHLRNDRHYVNLLDAADPNLAQENSRYRSDRTELQWNNEISLPDWGRIEQPKLTFGYDRIDDSARIKLDSSSFGSPFTQDLRAGTRSNAGWAGLQAVVLSNLTLTANARQEATSGSASAFTWRTGGVYEIPNLRARLKASYGTAFRAPSLFDRYGIDNYGYVGNPALRPERSHGWEVGGSADFAAFGREDFARIDVTFFHNDVSDLIATQFTPAYTQVNIGRARMQGVESELTLRPLNWFSSVLGYTYTDARDLGTQTLLLRRPRHAVTLTARLQPLPGLTIAPALSYTGAFADQLVDDTGFPIGVGRAKPGMLLNVSVNYEATKAVTLFVNARNIGNSRFEPASGFAGPGPSVMAGTRVRF